MLEGQVEVRNDAGRRRHDVEQGWTDFGRLQVAHAHPVDKGGELRQREALEEPYVAEVLPVRGAVLAHEHELADAVLDQPLRLGDDLIWLAGQVGAAKGRDRAEGAPPVAAGGDLQRRRRPAVETASQCTWTRRRRDAWREVAMTGRQRRGARSLDRGDQEQRAPIARLMRRRNVAVGDGTQRLGDIGVRIEAEHGVGLGQRSGQLIAVSLREATDRDHGLIAVGDIQQGVDRVLLRRLDEAAGIDQDRVGASRVVGELPATVDEAAG